MPNEMTKHEWIGTYSGPRIADLAEEISRQKKARRDYIYPASKLSLTDDGRLVFADTDTFGVGGIVYTEWADAERAADDFRIRYGTHAAIESLGKSGALPLSATAEVQLADRLGIPIKFVRMLRTPTVAKKGNTDPVVTAAVDVANNIRVKLAADNFRTLLGVENRRFLVRTLDGEARAVMSDRYRVLNNGDLFFAAAQRFLDVGAELWTARLAQDGFQMLGVAKGISGKVTTDRTFDPGDGWQSRWYGTDGDVHNAAVSIRNSETGQGGLSVKPAVLRRVCANFNVWADGYGAFHLGGKRANDGLLKHLGLGDTDENGIISAETAAAESNVIWMKVKDIIGTAFDPVRFKNYIDRLNGATTMVLEKPEKAVANIVAEYQISDERAAQILGELMRSGDRTRYGVVQAVTWSAHKADEDARPDEAADLESLGGELIEMEDKKFAILGEMVTT